MKYLILGSQGIIGSTLTKYLNKRGHETLEFDIVRSPLEDLRIPKNPLLAEKIKKCDFVYFLAYDIGGAKYLKNYQNSFQYIHNNIIIMKETFEILDLYKKPFIFSSSEMAYMNYSSYGCLKSIGEYYTRSLNRPVIKLWNVYGIEYDQKKLHVIADFIHMALRHKKIEMLTDGTEERQMLFADDACECLEIISQNFDKFSKDQEIHIAEFKWHTIKEIANEISEYFNVPVIINKRGKDLTHQGQKFEPNQFILKYWKPKTSLKQGIHFLCNYYKDIYE